MSGEKSLTNEVSFKTQLLSEIKRCERVLEALIKTQTSTEQLLRLRGKLEGVRLIEGKIYDIEKTLPNPESFNPKDFDFEEAGNNKYYTWYKKLIGEFAGKMWPGTHDYQYKKWFGLEFCKESNTYKLDIISENPHDDYQDCDIEQIFTKMSIKDNDFGRDVLKAFKAIE